MKLFFHSLFLLAFSFICQSVEAQSIDTSNTPVWIQMMDDPNANFFETQKAFELYWDGRERQPGDGWKVFKRWEWFWSERVNENGSFPDANSTKTAYESWEINYNQSLQGTESIVGDWIEIGPRPKPVNGTGQPNGNGRLSTICFHPTDSNTFWVGAPAGGLWKTTNGGQSWTSNTDNLPTLGVSSMLVDPVNTNILYIGTGDRDAGDAVGLGVYKSTNGGTSWFQSNSTMGNKEVGAMIMHPSNGQYILAATSGGIYRTTNGGSSWTLESSNSSFYKDIKWKPGSSTVAYATETSGPAGFYKTTDGGNTWVEITNGLPSNGQRFAIGVSNDDPNTVYVLSCIGSAFQGVYKSTDSGVSFSTQSTTPNILGWAENGSGTGGQGWYDLCIEVDPNNSNIIFVGGVNIWKSTDGGINWDCAAHWVGSSTAAAVHADHHWMAYSTLTGALYDCNDGGLYLTHDGGNTWPELSSGLGISQIYRIGVSQNTHELVINGYQDNGTAIWDDTLFRTERGGDGMECIIDPNNDAIMYATVYYGNITRSTNSGIGFSSFAANGVNGITEDGAWVAPYILDKANSDIMFIGYKNVWRTTNATAGTPVFDQISNNLAGSNSSNMRRVKQSKISSDRLFAVRSDNKIFRSDNALSTTPTWLDLTSNLPGSGTLVDIETSPFSNNILWIIRGNTVYTSSNSGVSWTNYSSGLPSITKNCLVADPLSNDGLYIGTDAGVYYIDNTLSSWIPFDEGLPINSEITELDIYHPTGNWTASRIRAATYGRGLWESDLYNPGNIAPTAFIETSLSETEICDNDTISLISNSAYGVNSYSWTITPNTGIAFVGGTTNTSAQPKVIISTGGSYNVKLVVTNAFGSDSTTLTSAINVNTGLPLTFLEDFEDEFTCSTNTCNLSCGLIDWTNLSNGIDDDIDFRVNSGGTPSGNTGPDMDFVPGTISGKYVYTEASFCFGNEAIMESPCIVIDEVTNPKISFAYHMNATNASQMGDLKLDIKSNGTWSNLSTINGSQGNSWLTNTQNLNSYIGQTVKFRFKATTGSQFQSDIALDAINIYGNTLANFSASSTEVCAGTAIQLSDSSSLNPTSWAWSITPNTFSWVNGTNANSQHPQVQFNSAGSYSITLQATNSYGSDFEVKNNYISVFQPSPILEASNLNATFCANDTVSISATPGYTNYDFSLNGSVVQSSSDSLFSYTNFSNNDLVVASVTDQNGCTGESNSLTIIRLANPVVSLFSNKENNEICEGDTVVFSSNNLGILEYNFLLNALSTQADSTNTFIINSLENQDSLVLIATDTNGCSGTSNTIITTVFPIPNTPFINILSDSLECSTLGQLYEWEHDSIFSLEISPFYPKQGDGAYRVRVSDFGCWSPWSEPLIITGIGEIDKLKFKVYPSPASDFIYLEQLSHFEIKTAKLKIIDMQGKVVLEKTINNSELATRTSLNIKKLASGSYNLVVDTPLEIIAIQFVKENR